MSKLEDDELPYDDFPEVNYGYDYDYGSDYDYDEYEDYDGEDVPDLFPPDDDTCTECDGTGEFPVDRLCKACNGKGSIGE